MSARLAVLAAALLAVAGCDAATVPARVSAYAFTTRETPPRVLHWPTGSAIRVYAAPAAGPAGGGVLADALDAAVGVWNPAALYGEYRLVPVTAAADADVVVVWSDATPPVGLAACAPQLAGYGVTTFCLAADGKGLEVFPLAPGGGGRVRMVITILGALRADTALARRTLSHELGHALGLLRHSPDAADLMYRAPTVDGLSAADRASVELLYHTPADIEPQD